MKYKVVVFGTKQSTSYLINKFKDDIDLVVTVNDNKSYNIAGKGDVIGTANDNNIECIRVWDVEYAIEQENCAENTNCFIKDSEAIWSLTCGCPEEYPISISTSIVLYEWTLILQS